MDVGSARMKLMMDWLITCLPPLNAEVLLLHSRCTHLTTACTSSSRASLSTCRGGWGEAGYGTKPLLGFRVHYVIETPPPDVLPPVLPSHLWDVHHVRLTSQALCRQLFHKLPPAPAQSPALRPQMYCHLYCPPTCGMCMTYCSPPGPCPRGSRNPRSSSDSSLHDVDDAEKRRVAIWGWQTRGGRGAQGSQGHLQTVAVVGG